MTNRKEVVREIKNIVAIVSHFVKLLNYIWVKNWKEKKKTNKCIFFINKKFYGFQLPTIYGIQNTIIIRFADPLPGDMLR